jgi:hypothetical protein
MLRDTIQTINTVKSVLNGKWTQRKPVCGENFYTVPRVQNVNKWNVMAHAQKPDFVFRRNGRVHLNRRGRQFSRLLAAEVCASAVVILDIPCSEVVWRVLATHSIRQFRLHCPSRASPRAITFQLDSTCVRRNLPQRGEKKFGPLRIRCR